MPADASNGITHGEPDSVRFIPEQVAATDQFQHRAVAKVIARAIVRHRHLRTIGLLGRWGSGKSTTVGFVPEEIEKLGKEPCLLFTYDAWLYQSDAPRPAFIDALFEFLVKEGRLDRKDWNDHVAMLTGHLEVTYASERPFANLTSRLMLLAALGSPLGVLLMARHTLINEHWKDWTEARLAVVAAGLVLLPIAVWILAQACRVLGWIARTSLLMLAPTAVSWIKGLTPSANSFWGKRLARWRARKILLLDQRFSPTPTNETWSWILSRKPQATEQRKVGKATPSSTDFQRAFRSMVEAALKAGDDQPRLVITVDNLDRLPVPEAVALWSVIRGFFLGLSSEGDSLERLTILLPMDEGYVAQIQGQVTDTSTGPGAPDHQLAQGLMEKTFDLTLRLPRPAFTNWQGYFAEQLGWALYRTTDDDDVRNIGTILNETWSRRTDQITPRMVNAMVNRIVATWLRWEDSEIELLVVAFYAINQDAIDADLLGALKSPNILVGNAPDAWQSWFAAMHYGIEPEVAIQLLLGSSIIDAIDDYESLEFADLAHYHAFPELVRSIIEGFDSSTADTVVLQAADLLNETPVVGRIAQRHLLALLCRAFEPSRRSNLLGEPQVPGLRALIEAGVQGFTPEQLLSQFVQRLGSDNGWDKKDASAIDALMVRISPLQDENGLRVYLTVRPDRFFDIAETAWNHPEWLAMLKTTDDAKVMEDLTKLLERPERAGDALLFVWHSAVMAPWDPVVDALRTGFEGRRSMPEKAVALGLGLLRQSEPTARAIVIENKTGVLYSHIDSAYRQGDSVLTARLLALALLEDDAQIPNHPWTTHPSPEDTYVLIQEVQQYLESFGEPTERSPERLDAVAQKAPHLAGLIARLLERHVRDAHAEYLDGLVSRLGFYQQEAPTTDVIALIKAMHMSTSFWPSLDAIPNNEAWVLLRFLRDEQVLPTDEVNASLGHRLQTVGNNEWTAALMGDAMLLDTLSSLPAPSLDLPQLAIALNSLIGQLPTRPDRLGRWASAVRGLRTEVRNQLIGQLALNLLMPDHAGVAGAALIHLPEIAHSAPFKTSPDLAIRQVLPGLLSSTAAGEDVANAGRELISIVLETSADTRAVIATSLNGASLTGTMSSAGLALSVVWNPALQGAGDAA